MAETERQQRMVERILEDERLRGDLEDTAATALVQWASERAGAVAADPARSDEAVEADVQAVRKAARAAVLSGETDPQRLLAVAETNLASSVTLNPESAMAAPAAAPAQPAAQAPQPQNETSAAAAAPAGTVPAEPAAQAPQAQADRVPAQPAAQAPQTQSTEKKTSGASQSASATRHPRKRKRSRLANFLKHLAGRR
jgi:hypothetical protein